MNQMFNITRIVGNTRARVESLGAGDQGEDRELGAERRSCRTRRPSSAKLLSRRQVLQRATVLGLGGLVLSALPAAERLLAAVAPAQAAVEPRRRDAAGVRRHADPGPQGATAPTSATRSTRRRSPACTPSRARSRPTRCCSSTSPLIGFDALEPAFLAEVETRSLPRGGQFLDLPFAKRVAVCVDGLAATNPTRARSGRPRRRSPFAAFLVAATQENATIDTASGYQVMGHPGTAPNGYADYSYGRKLSRERTANGSLP